MTRKQRLAWAGAYCRWSVARREDDPGKPEDARRLIERDEAYLRPAGGRPPSPLLVVWGLLPAFVVERGIAVGEPDMDDLALDCAEVEVVAKKALLRNALGDNGNTPELDAFPAYVPVKAGNNSRGKAVLSVEDIGTPSRGAK